MSGCGRGVTEKIWDTVPEKNRKVPTSLPSGKMTERRGEEREKQNTLIFWLRRKPQSIIYTAELTGEHQAS